MVYIVAVAKFPALPEPWEARYTEKKKKKKRKEKEKEEEERKQVSKPKTKTNREVE